MTGVPSPANVLYASSPAVPTVLTIETTAAAASVTISPMDRLVSPQEGIGAAEVDAIKTDKTMVGKCILADGLSLVLGTTTDLMGICSTARTSLKECEMILIVWEKRENVMASSHRVLECSKKGMKVPTLILRVT